MPLLISKFILVLMLTISVSATSIYFARAKNGDTEANLKKVSALGTFTLFAGIGIIVLAVLNFH